MHLRCPRTAATATTADPRAPTEHIGSEWAHTQALHLMMQLCSLASSTSAHIKDQLVLEVEEHRRIAERNDTRTTNGRVVTVDDLPRRSARGPQSWSFASRWIQPSVPRSRTAHTSIFI